MSTPPLAPLRLQRAAAAFAAHYGPPPLAVCDAPGRANLIGEHIDYAGGSVLPIAIQYGIAVAAGPADSPSPPGSAGPATAGLELHLAPASPVQPSADQLASARRLAEAVLVRLQPGVATPAGGLRLCVYSDLPLGAGLASSAAFAVAVAGAACASTAAAARPTPLVLCHLCQEAELAATGVQCGLMDQYAVMFGQAGQAVHFDASALSHETIPLDLDSAVLTVIDSGQPRTLAASGYNQRRAELEQALATFGGDRSQLEDFAQPGTRRLRHVIYEQARVFAAIVALGRRDSADLGALLSRSQESLRDLFEVSTPELNLLCRLLDETALPNGRPVAYGSRLTGAGFGGNVLALLRRGALSIAGGGPGPLEALLGEYAQLTGLIPTVRFVEPSDGALLQHANAEPEPLRDWLEAGGPAGQPAIEEEQ